MEFVLVIILGVFYFLPTIVASSRGHQSVVGIFFLNLFLGWTLLVWVVAFIWSFTNPTQVIVSNPITQSAADEIQKLARLKEQGLLTDGEFDRKKQQILDGV